MTKIDFYIASAEDEMANHVVSLNTNHGLIPTGKAGVGTVVCLTNRTDVYRIWAVYINNGEPLYKMWQMTGDHVWYEIPWSYAKECAEILPVFN